MAKKFVYYKNSWHEGMKASNSDVEEYSYVKNGYFFHDANEIFNFVNINDEEDFEI